MSELVCRTLELLAESKDAFASAVKNIFDTRTMATLKISDLSVGDWVGIDQAELNMPSDDLATAYIEKLRKPIRIKGISEDSDMVIADIEIVDEWGSIMMKCEHLSPIPITAEILEKNGFEEDNNGHYALKIGGIIAVDIEYTGGIWELSILDAYALQYAGKMQVTIAFASSIHSLQHALRLAGVDKEINL